MSIRDLKSEIGESTGKMVALGILTFGVYYFIWLIERYNVFNRLSSHKIIDRNLIVAAAIVMGIGNYMSLISEMGTAVMAIENMCNIGWAVLFIAMAFKMARVLEDHIRGELQVAKHFNSFYLVIFNIFYINYIIQHLDEIEQESGIRDGNNLDQLEKLAQLKEKGVLSDEEFQAQKAKLLALKG